MYTYISQLPPQVMDILSPDRAEEWRLAFNAAEEEGLEEGDAYKQAWQTILNTAFEGEIPARDNGKVVNINISAEEHFGYIVDLSEMEFAEGVTRGWLQALPLGKWKHPIHGDIEVTFERAKEFATNVNRGVRGQDLDIDYVHKGDAAKGDKAAGWVQKARADARRGLELLIEFTGEAVKEIRDRAWRYFSPEFVNRWEHPETGVVYSNVLLGGGLTNRPFLKGIAPINLSEFRDTFEEDHASLTDDEHFDLAEVDSSSWDGNAAMSSCSDASCYRAICAGERTTGEAGERGHWALPHHRRAGAPPNANGVRNALARLSQTQGLKNTQAARAHLEGHLRSIQAEEERMDEFLKQLAEALGIEVVEDDAEATQKAIATKLAEVVKKAEEEPPPDEGDPEPDPEPDPDKEPAMSFEEKFPEEAKRLTELARKNRLHEIERGVRQFEEENLKGDKKGLAPEANAHLQGLLVGLSEEKSNEVLQVFAEIISDGIVEFGERGSTQGTDADPTKKLEDRAYTLMEEAEKDGKTLSFREAFDQAADEDPATARLHVASVATGASSEEE